MSSFPTLFLWVGLLAGCRTDVAVTPSPQDGDGDGFTADVDCDDGDFDVHPGAEELCNGLDDDCDGRIDDEDTDLEPDSATPWYLDQDGDGYGLTVEDVRACEAPGGYARWGGDCDDGDAAVHPDADEVCNGVDDDCDDLVDDADPALELETAETWYRDGDGDGHGLIDEEAVACTAPDGFLAGSEDCDDTDADIHPGAVEVCNGVDDDCDGLVDDADDDLEPTSALTWYEDADGDLFGDSGSPLLACEAPDGAVPDDGDCDDADAEVHPDADEVCNEVDDDCDGLVDGEDDSLTGGADETWYADDDSDGYGDAGDAVVACEQPAGRVSDDTDCDDTDVDVHPAATEVCNGVDDDCDSLVDDDDSSLDLLTATEWWVDADGDGYGDSSAASTTACSGASGTVADGSDCDDGDSGIHPGATERCDEVDDDCDGVVDAPSGKAGFLSSGGTFSDYSTALAGTASSPAGVTLSRAGTLYICPGTWYTNIYINSVTVDIMGMSTSSDTVLDGASSDTVVHVHLGASDISDVTITHGYDRWPGGVVGYGSDVRIENVVITDNEATDYVGGIMVYSGGTLECVDSEISNNVSAGWAGGATVQGYSVASFDGCLITGNESSGDAGGFSARTYSDVTMVDTEISDNSTEGYGGGLYIVSGSTLDIEDSVVSDNHADDMGGGVMTYHLAELTMTDTEVSGNTSADGAGLAFLYDADGVLDECVVEDNTASGNGGGIYFYDYQGSPTLDVTDTDFLSNSAEDLYNEADGDHSLGLAASVTCDGSGCQ